MGDQTAPTDLVGRDVEFATLHAAAAQTSRLPQVILVSGEAGIGKTVLVEQFCRQIRDQNVPTWRGGCLELAGDHIPYAPVIHVLRQMRRSNEMPNRPAGRTLARPELHLAGSSPSVSVAINRGDLYEQWLETFDTAVTSGDGVLVVEDLHWADPATLDFLLFLTNCLPRGLLLVLTYRDDELDIRPGLKSFLGMIGRDSRTHRIDLPRLSRAQLNTLAESVQAPDTAPPDLDKVYTRSSGNPFLAIELLSNPEPLVAHRTVEEVLLSRARYLTRSALDLLELIAIFERPVTDDLLKACTGWDDPHVTAGLREHIASGLLVIDQNSDEYLFRHVLTREAVLHRLLPGERRRLHAVAAAAIAEQSDTSTSPSRAAECATHWYLSGDQSAALPAAVHAGQLAAGVFAWSEAALHFTRALTLAAEHERDANKADNDARRDLLMRAAEANHWAGATEEAVTLARTALAIARDHLEQASVLERLGMYLLDIGRLDEGRDAAERADLLVGDLAPTQLSAAVAALKAGCAVRSGRYQVAISAGRHAVEIATSAESPIVEGQAELDLGVALIENGSLEEGTDLARRGHQLLTEWADPTMRIRAATTLSYALLMAGNPTDACDAATAGIAMARRYGMTLGTAAVTVNAILALRLTGRWSEAEQLLDEALAAENPASGSAPYLYLDRAELDTGKGNWDRAHDYLDRAWQAARGHETPTLIAELHLMTSVLAIEQNDLTTAREHIEVLSEQLGDTRMPARIVAQHCCIALRLDAEISQRIPWATDLPSVLGNEERQALLSRVYRAQSTASNPEIDALTATATAEHNRRQPSADPELWQRAAAAWEKASQPYEVAYCCYRWAGADLDKRNSSRAAAAPLRRSHEIAAALGAAPLQQKAEDLARRSRISLTPPAPDVETAPASNAARLGITQREQDVLQTLTLGLSNREIANRLYLSPRTVEVHVSNLLRKLGATNRAQATRIATDLALLSKPVHRGIDPTQ